MKVSTTKSFFIPFSILFLVLLIGACYKYNEWFVLNYLNNLQREADLSELRGVQKINSLYHGDEFSDIFLIL